jgi:Peptidase C13 family
MTAFRSVFSLAFACILAVAPRAASAQHTHVVVIAGIGGEPRYQQMFFDWGSTMAKAATDRWGVPKNDVVFLAEQPERDPSLVTGKSTKIEIEKAFSTLASSAGQNDVVFILLIGHGSFQNNESRLSIPGPDLTAEDFAALVTSLGSRRVVLANVASASGEFVKAISGPNRIVITSTKSGMERNQAKFGKYFVDAFAVDGADTDKDGAVSMLEAFEYAHRETLRAYETDKTILTEHAVLDDNGDGKGESEFARDAQEGRLARATFLGKGAVVAGAAAPPDASPALRALFDEKAQLEKQIEDLRAAKATMDPQQYQDRLEKLLVDLALKNQAIRAAGGKP